MIDTGVDATLPAPLLLSNRSNFATIIPSLQITPSSSQELEVYHGPAIEWAPASTGQVMSLTPIHEVDTPNTDELEGFINEVLEQTHSVGVSPIPEIFALPISPLEAKAYTNTGVLTDDVLVISPSDLQSSIDILVGLNDSVTPLPSPSAPLEGASSSPFPLPLPLLDKPYQSNLYLHLSLPPSPLVVFLL